MGIPRLLHHMQDYGSAVQLGTHWQTHVSRPTTPDQEQHKSPNQVVIDGPSLAYYAYDRALAGKHNARNAFEAMPSYGEVGEVAVEFLSLLESHGLMILAIFFDGVLPEAKRETRVKRLQSSLNQLLTFRNMHSDGVLDDNPNMKTSAFWAQHYLPERLKALPASPFLVPAVIDHLNARRFSKYVHVVPAEADVFCADRVRAVSGTAGCWLLSSDTDLLVHDLGPHGSVLRFQDVAVATFPRRTVLKGIEYHPMRIAERLGLGKLAPLAFALVQDPHRSLQSLVHVAKQCEPSSAEYRTFLEEFAPLHSSYKTKQSAIDAYNDLLPAFSASQDNPFRPHLLCDFSRESFDLWWRQQAVFKEEAASRQQFMHDLQLRMLDPRVSELVHQVGPALTTRNPSPTQQLVVAKECMVYLPFLIDDPGRASAWRLSAELRHLGYSILWLLLPTRSIIHEFERRGLRIAGSAVPRLSEKEMLNECHELTANISVFMPNSGDLHLKSPLHFWKLYGTLYLCDKLVTTGERQAYKREILQLLQGRQGLLDWPFIHRCAQLHGIWYSFRMLGQLLRVVRSSEGINNPDILKAVTDLDEKLSGMPSADKLFDPVPMEGEDAISETCLADAIANFPSVAENPEVIEKQERAARRAKAIKRKKGRNHADGEERGQAGAAPVSNNRFGALSAIVTDGE